MIKISVLTYRKKFSNFTKLFSNQLITLYVEGEKY